MVLVPGKFQGYEFSADERYVLLQNNAFVIFSQPKQNPQLVKPLLFQIEWQSTILFDILLPVSVIFYILTFQTVLSVRSCLLLIV